MILEIRYAGKKYRVKLTEEERDYLIQQVSSGKSAVRKLTHAQILLHADEAAAIGSLKDIDIVKAAHISCLTAERVRKRFVEEGLESALNPKTQVRRRAKKLDGEAEAFLVATACSAAPAGHADLLAEQLVECNIVDSVSGETVRKTLKKTNLSLG